MYITKNISKSLMLVLSLILAFFCLLGLTSCSINRVDGVTLKSFKTEKDAYNYNEKLTFVLEFENDKNFTINSVVINGKTYSVLTSDNSYRLVYVMDDELKYTVLTDIYTLSKFTYTKTVDNVPETVSVKTNAKCVITHEFTVTDDFKLTNYTIVPKEGEENEFFINEKVIVTINVENTEGYKVSKFEFKYYVGEEYYDEVSSAVYSKDASQNNTHFILELTLPEEANIYNIVLASVWYAKDTQFVTCDFTKQETSITTKTLDVQKRQIEVLSMELYALSDNIIEKDINLRSYTDETSTIDLKIKIKNESNLKITALVINDQTYGESAMSLNSTSPVFKVTTIKLSIKSSASTTEGNISVCKIELQKIRFIDKTSTELLIPVEISSSIYIYDKVINSVEDLKYLKIDETTKTITGNYILGKDITLSDSYHRGFFAGYTFNGLLEGNGHKIQFSSDATISTIPMFESIGEQGVIKNIYFSQLIVKNSNAVANVNNGTLKNVQFNVSLNHVPLATQSQDIRGGLFGINNGTISDVLLDGSLSITGSNVHNVPYKFSLVADTNNGNIVRVVNNVKKIEAASTMRHSFVFLTSRENNGTINTVIYTLYGVSLDQYEGVALVTDSLENGENATYKNVYISSTFLDKVQSAHSTDYPDYDSSWSLTEKITWLCKGIYDAGKQIAFSIINNEIPEGDVPEWITFNQDLCPVKYATEADLGYDSSDREAEITFYSVLGFASGGIDSFWKYSTSTIGFSWKIN